MSLDLKRGEALGLVGDNGAGKSTLINILSGVHTADEGEILVEGRPVRIARPRDAMNLGIETIYQYNSMVPTMHFKSKVMILDEPTNHLSVKETSKVIGFVCGLKAQGVTGVFISHNMIAASSGRIVGATIGNDVNLRDVEGRSALLLGKAKDNNASASLGPFIRLFDDTFSIDDVKRAVVRLKVEGEDGFSLEGASSMAEISRSPEELVAAAMGPHHQYPDGLALYLGTMAASGIPPGFNVITGALYEKDTAGIYDKILSGK